VKDVPGPGFERALASLIALMAVVCSCVLLSGAWTLDRQTEAKALELETLAVAEDAGGDPEALTRMRELFPYCRVERVPSHRGAALRLVPVGVREARQ
jgi:hypothetical protein